MVRQSILHNGIRVVTEHLPGYHSVAIGLWVMFGSRHELAEERGVSHLLEHMLFKGTERRSAADIASEIDAVGGSLNAFTAREFSCFHARVLNEDLPLAVDLLTDMFCHPRFDEDELRKEQGVVLQEIARLQDTPEDYIHELFSRTLWGYHPLGCSSSGEPDVLAGVTGDRLRTYMAEHFIGSRLLVCAAGDVEHDDLVELIGSKLADLSEGSPIVNEAPPAATRRLDVTERASDHVHLCLGVRAVSQDDPDRFTQYMLDTILGASMSSRLFQAIRERHGLAYSIYSYPTCYADAGAEVVYCGCASSHLQAAAEVILEQFRQLVDNEVSEDEVSHAYHQIRGKLLLSLENISNRMSRLAKGMIYLGKPPIIDEVLEKFAAVDSGQLRQFAARIFADDRLNLHLLGSPPPEGLDFDRIRIHNQAGGRAS
ncbi:MAG: peptidase M16 [Desulfuromonas sp.]|nr:MAG: peptidase M16 [Desulfuromonas sp.]